MENILITGGTGTIGTRLTALLIERGYTVTILTREIPTLPAEKDGIQYALWNIEAQTIDESAIRKADHVIHLTGAGVADKRWNVKRKQEILDSRTHSSALLVKALTVIPNHVKSVISASAIGWYGADTAESKLNGFTESDKADTAFLGETCRLWEASIEPVTALGKRLVKFRTGIVLSVQGGAFAEFIKPLTFGLATILGNGRQVISWIHEDDLCAMYLYAIQNVTLEGSFNAVAPVPVTNRRFILKLAKIRNGIFFLPMYVPAFLLKGVMGEMSIEVLKSTTVSCKNIVANGFQFQFPDAESAIKNLLRK
jgi:uncharacterized protein (TIGR01777 family)